MEFGISLPPVDPRTLLHVSRAAEAEGLRSFWLYDAHRVWMDPYPLLALVAHATQRLHFGICVTNAVTRDPSITAFLTATLHALSGGRAELGLGRGDASVRGMGKKPASLAELRAAVETFRAEAAAVDPSWRNAAPIPVHIGTYGPRGLHLAGAVADGVILQFVDDDLVRWAVGCVAGGAREAGREPGSVRIMCAAPMAVDLAPDKAVELTRWFARMIGPDLAPLLLSKTGDALPEMQAWARRFTEGGGAPALADEMASRWALCGSTDEVRDRVRGLEALGVTEVNVFAAAGDLSAPRAIARLREG